LNTVNRNTDPYKDEVSDIIKLHKARKITKAEVYLVTRKDSKIVFKDFRKNHTLIRLTYGRYSLYREAKAYSRLEGIPGVPRCFGLDDREVLKLEYIKGQSLSSFKRGKVPESVFVQLKKIISAMHEKGVANGDIHRSNVLLTPDWDVYLVDYASSFFTDFAGKPGFIFRAILYLDRFAFERMRAKYLCLKVPAPKGFVGVCYVFCATIKRTIKKIKKCIKANVN